MSAIVPYVSFISQYIPAAVKDAAGLCPQISEAVRHVTWLSVDRVFWPGAEVARFFLVLGYADGFQLWDLQDPGAAREVLSKKGNWGILQAKMLPAPMAPTAPSAAPARQAAHGMIGLQHAPLLAYQRQGVPNVVRLFSLRSNDDVHLLRLIEPARSLQASRRYFAVGFARQAELYDALTFEALFSVQCSEGPSFVLGHRWLAYNLPPQQSAASSAGLAAGRGLLAGGARQLPTVMRDGVRYLGQVGQRTLDNMLMPLPEGADQPPVARAGVVVVRDVASRGVVAQFEDHSEPVDAMAWDPSGLQLVTAGAQGHQVLVHRALLGMQQALVVQDAAGDGPARGGVVFQHLYTLSRGVTPAVISDIAVSDNGQFVAVSSAKGTTHVFRLPPLHSAAIGHHCLAEQGAVRLAPAQPRTSAPAGEVGVSLSMGGGGVAHRPATLHACTRVRLGSVLLQEGLMPKCGFPAPAPPPSSGPSRMFVATRAGTVQLYTLSPGGPSGGAGGAAAAAGGGDGAAPPQTFGSAAVLGAPCGCCEYSGMSAAPPESEPDRAFMSGFTTSSCARIRACWPPGMTSSRPMERSALRWASRISEGLRSICMDWRSTSGSSSMRAISGRLSMSSFIWGFMRIIMRIISGLLIICWTMGESMSCCIISGFCAIAACDCAIICAIGSPELAPAPAPIRPCSGFAWVEARVCSPAGTVARGALLRQWTVAPARGA